MDYFGARKGHDFGAGAGDVIAAPVPVGVTTDAPAGADAGTTAAAGVAEITGNHATHSRAARAIAEECFRSDKVLGDLLRKLGLS